MLMKVDAYPRNAQQHATEANCARFVCSIAEELTSPFSLETLEAATRNPSERSIQLAVHASELRS